jgi:hypothetical protein
MPRTFTPTDAQIAKALTIACPVCGVGANKPCRTGGYQKRVDPPHTVRVKAALKAFEEGVE